LLGASRPSLVSKSRGPRKIFPKPACPEFQYAPQSLSGQRFRTLRELQRDAQIA
jgi:hypothetical protein